MNLIPHQELRNKTTKIAEENRKLSSLVVAKMEESFDPILSIQLVNTILENANEQLKNYNFFIKEGILEYQHLKEQAEEIIIKWETVLKSLKEINDEK